MSKIHIIILFFFVSFTGMLRSQTIDHYEVKSGHLLQEQIIKSNAEYDIRGNFDLRGRDLIVPEHCVLHFWGGECYNGGIVLKNSTLYLHYASLRLTKPLYIENSLVCGEGGVIGADKNYGYPCLIESHGEDIIKNVRIELNDNSIIGVCAKGDNEQFTAYKLIIDNVRIKNASQNPICDIREIKGNKIKTKEPHRLKSGDLIEIKSVDGGFSKSTPSLSVYNDLFIVRVIGPNDIVIHHKSTNGIAREASFDGFTPYQEGGTIFKGGCGIALIEEGKYTYLREACLNNIIIENCYLGIYDVSPYNRIDKVYFDRGDKKESISMLFKSTIRGTVVRDCRLNAPVMGRCGIHGIVFDGISAYMAGYDAPVFDIQGINSNIGNAGGEVEGVTITNSYLNASSKEAPVIRTNGNDFSITNTFIANNNDVWSFIEAKGINHLYDNLVFSGGQCHFNTSSTSTTSATYRKINTTQTNKKGKLILYCSRLYDKDSPTKNNGYVRVSDTSFDVSIGGAGSYDAQNYIFENISGTLDLKNSRGGTVVNCPKVINNAFSYRNNIEN